MQILNTNLKKTTMEHHKPFRTFYIEPKGGIRQLIQKKMPKVNHIPTLWI